MKINTPEDWKIQLPPLWPAAKGSLAKVYKPCIRPNCALCASGQKHPAWLFAYSHNGKRRCLYVPLALVKTMQQALKNGRRIEKLLHQLGPTLVQQHRKTMKTQPKPPLKS